MVRRSAKKTPDNPFALNLEFADGHDPVTGRPQSAIRYELDDDFNLVGATGNWGPHSVVPHAAAGLALATQVARDVVAGMPKRGLRRP